MIVRDEEAVGSNPATPTHVVGSVRYRANAGWWLVWPGSDSWHATLLDFIRLLASGDERVAAQDELVNHFVRCYHLVAQATGADSTSAKAVRQLPCVFVW